MKRPIAIVFLAVLAAASAVAQSREARTIKYSAKDIVLIKAKLRYTTLIVLPQNEKILDFVTGDKDFWIVEGNQNFCYIKPAKQGSTTDVTLITAAGNVYSFLLKEVGETDESDLKVFIEPKDQSIVQALNAPRSLFLRAKCKGCVSRLPSRWTKQRKPKKRFGRIIR